MLVARPARAGEPRSWMTMIAPRVGTIWFPTPTNAWAVASRSVLRLITAGMVRGRVTPRREADGIASGAAGRGWFMGAAFPPRRTHYRWGGCAREPLRQCWLPEVTRSHPAALPVPVAPRGRSDVSPPGPSGSRGPPPPAPHCSEAAPPAGASTSPGPLGDRPAGAVDGVPADTL